MDISRWNRNTSLLALALSFDHMLGMEVCEEKPEIYTASGQDSPVSKSKGSMNSSSRRPLRRVRPRRLRQASAASR